MQVGWSSSQRLGMSQDVDPIARNEEPLVGVKTMTHSAMGSDEWATIYGKQSSKWSTDSKPESSKPNIVGMSEQCAHTPQVIQKISVGLTLAVRRVTQDNAGKKTAGVDGVNSLTATTTA